jgi:DNA polymerase I-like protein with 3'-5' exonuclease and polymerase domains
LNILTLDCETTGACNNTKGNAYSEPNKLCYVGCSFNGSYSDYAIEYGMEPFGNKLEEIRNLIRSSDIIVGFNLKFDFSWLRKYGIIEYEDKKIWDCQAVEFILSKQKHRFPSLQDSLVSKNLEGKLDVVRIEYWEKGIDTDCVPREVLQEYLKRDVIGTTELYKEQTKEVGLLPMATQRLISLVNQDLLVLEEMESNGIKLDMEGCHEEVQKLQKRVSELYRTLDAFWPDIPLLWTSNDCVSAALYGGIVKEDYRETVRRVLKSGEVTIRERWSVKEHKLPTLVEPLPNTKLKKEGYYKTDEGTLRKLKTNKHSKKIIDILLELSKLEKLIGTYFVGFPKLYEEMMWTDGILHGQLNQVVVVTGRLSSNAPNQQNLPDAMRRLIESRF